MSTIDIDRESKKILLARLSKRFTKEVAQDIYDLLTPVDKAGRSQPASIDRLKIDNEREYKVGGIGAGSDDISRIESYNRIPSDRARYAIYYFVEELLGLSELKLDPTTIEIVEKKRKRKSKPEDGDVGEENETELTKYYAIAYGRTKANQGVLRYRLVISHTFLRLEMRARRPNKSKTKSKQKPAYQAYWVPIRAAKVKGSSKNEKYELVPYPETTILFDKATNTLTEITPNAEAVKAWNLAIEIGKQNVIALAKNLRSECEQAIISLKTPVEALSESYIFRMFLQYNSLVYDEVKTNFLALDSDKFSILAGSDKKAKASSQAKKAPNTSTGTKEIVKPEKEATGREDESEAEGEGGETEAEESSSGSKVAQNMDKRARFLEKELKFKNKKTNATDQQFDDILNAMLDSFEALDSFKIDNSYLDKYKQEIADADNTAQDPEERSNVLFELIFKSTDLGKEKGLNAEGLVLELADDNLIFKPNIIFDKYNKFYSDNEYNNRIPLVKSLYFKIFTYYLIETNINWRLLKAAGETISILSQKNTNSLKWQIDSSKQNRLIASRDKSTFKLDSLNSMIVKNLLVAKLKNPDTTNSSQIEAVKQVMTDSNWNQLESDAAADNLPKLTSMLTLPSIWLGDGLIEACYETNDSYASFDSNPGDKSKNKILFKTCILGGALNEIHIFICSNTSISLIQNNEILSERNKIPAFVTSLQKIDIKDVTDILFHLKSTISYDSSSNKVSLKYDLLDIRHGCAEGDDEIGRAIVNWALYIQLLPYMLGQLTALVGCYTDPQNNQRELITENSDKIKLHVAADLISKTKMIDSAYPELMPYFNRLQLAELLNMFLMNSTDGKAESIDIDMPSTIPEYPKDGNK